jgi:hypothetical protein
MLIKIGGMTESGELLEVGGSMFDVGSWKLEVRG